MGEVEQHTDLVADLEREVFYLDHAPEEEQEEKLRDLIAKAAGIQELDETQMARLVQLVLDYDSRVDRARTARKNYDDQIRTAENKRDRIRSVILPALQANGLNLRPHGKKRLQLTTGLLKWHSSKGGKLTWADKDNAREWAETKCPKAIDYARAPMALEPLKEHYERTGEVPPGTCLTEPKETFDVTT